MLVEPCRRCPPVRQACETAVPTARVRAPDRVASAQSTPMLYESRGKQYVVVAAGGHGKMKSGIGCTMGDSVVAFALP